MRPSSSRGYLLLPVLAALFLACGGEDPVDPGVLELSSHSLVIAVGHDSAQFIVSNTGGSKLILTLTSATLTVTPGVVSLQPGSDEVITVTVRERTYSTVQVAADDGQKAAVTVSVLTGGPNDPELVEFRDYLTSLPTMGLVAETDDFIAITAWQFSEDDDDLVVIFMTLVGDLDGVHISGKAGTATLSRQGSFSVQAAVHWEAAYTMDLTFEEYDANPQAAWLPDTLEEIVLTEHVTLSGDGGLLFIDGRRFDALE